MKEEYQIKEATIQDGKRLIVFLAECFESSIDAFVSLQLKLKEDPKRFATSHFYMEENGEIVGAAAVFADTLIVQDTVLSIGCVGNVCVKKEYRNQGRMQQLMAYASQKLQQGDFDLAYLGGIRERYHHFGFEVAINAKEYVFPTQDGINAQLTLKRMSLASGEDIQVLRALYDRNIERVDRTHYDFAHVCKTWNNDSYAIYLNNKIVGYLIYTEELFGVANVIQEWELQDSSLLQDVLISFTKMKQLEQVKLHVGEHEGEKIAQLDKICQYCGKRPTEMFRFLKVDKCIQAFLTLKQSYTTLEQGSLVIGIEKIGNYEIQVTDTVRVHKTEKVPELYVSSLGLMNIMVHLGEFVPSNRLTKSWFPLPVYIKNADAM